MSAIAGAVGLDGRPLAVADLRATMDILAPLGRDGAGCWAGRIGPMGVALGAVRRRRVPQDDADTQPVRVADGRVTVVADVVLDNRPELCRLLALPDAHDLADPVVVAHAYLRWGEACCEHLRGEFAIGVADQRRGGVFLARDHTGARPLHVHEGRGWVGFASTALAVTGYDGVDAAIDTGRAAEFLALVTASDRSWIRDVVPVPPATALWITPDGVRRRRYWRADTRTGRGSAAQYAEELRAVFDVAVRSRLRHRGAVGVQLSGGLDSTAVAATVAGQVAPEPVLTYTSVPPPGWTAPPTRKDPDESRLVHALVARHGNLRPAFVDARGAPVVDGDPELFAAGGTPVRNTLNMTWIRAIHRRAAADGVGLLLTGAAGNVSFSRDGGRWLVDLLAAARLAEAWREARAWSVAWQTPLRVTVRQSVLGPLAPAWLRRWRAHRRGARSRLERWLAVAALHPELAADPALHRGLSSMDSSSRDPFDYLDSRAAHAETFAAQAARGGWRHADPTEDVRLLEVCLRQPTWARRHRGADRAAARAAMRDRVPDEIRLRRVRGAQVPDWLDRITDARIELCQELAAAHEHAASRALINLTRLDGYVRDWPAPSEAGDRERLASHAMALPRALAVSRYLRWFDDWVRHRPGPARTTNGQ